MWFDCVIIDRVTSDGHLESYHIRACAGEHLTVDRLEDIDPSYRAITSKDMASIRLYTDENIESRVIQSKLSNFAILDDGTIRIQLDHWGIPVSFGYYSIIFPKGLRIRDIRIYDPYDTAEQLDDKRNYRDISAKWDATSEHSCAQILLQSKRGTFSLGVLATLSVADGDSVFVDQPGRIEVDFTDSRHRGHMWEHSFRNAVDDVTRVVKQDDPKFPDIKVGLSGPSISVNETLKYAQHKWKRWRERKDRS
jgi:hypothetical protein